MPGRRVRTTAQRPWIDWAYARSDRFPPRGVTPLTPIMGRATDPGENHDPGKDQRFTPSLTQEPRLENGLGGKVTFGPAGSAGDVARSRPSPKRSRRPSPEKGHP